MTTRVVRFPLASSLRTHRASSSTRPRRRLARPSAGRHDHDGDARADLRRRLPAAALPAARRRREAGHARRPALRWGRLAGLLPSLALLAVAVVALWDARAGAVSLLGLVAAVTPMALFCAASLSGSGLEIAAGVAFVAALLRLRRDARRAGAPRRRPGSGRGRRERALLALSRSASPVWVALAILLWSRCGAAVGVAPRSRSPGRLAGRARRCSRRPGAQPRLGAPLRPGAVLQPRQRPAGRPRRDCTQFRRVAHELVFAPGPPRVLAAELGVVAVVGAGRRARRGRVPRRHGARPVALIARSSRCRCFPSPCTC